MKSLAVISSVFVILNLPMYLCRLLFSGKDDEVMPSWKIILQTVCFILYYAHHAILFYVYIFNSPAMRKELIPTALKLLECYCLKNVPDFGHESV